MRQRVIVILDQDIDFLKDLCAYFKNHGYAVKTYCNVKDFKNAFDPKEPPHAVLVDFEIGCLGLMNDLRTHGITTMGITGHYHKKDNVTNMYLAGASDVKPKNDPEIIYHSIEAILERKLRGETQRITAN